MYHIQRLAAIAQERTKLEVELLREKMSIEETIEELDARAIDLQQDFANDFEKLGEMGADMATKMIEREKEEGF